MTTGQVAIRFSVEDEETVRTALERLGKDGEAALRRLDAAGKSGQPGLKSIDAIAGGVKERLTGLAVSLGPIGTGLIALGPAGLAGAAGIGALVAIIEKMRQEATWLANQANDIKNFATTVGLTTSQVQALLDVGADRGVVPDAVRAFVEKFTTQMDQLRRGSGELVDQIARIDPALAQQLATARDAAEAWDLVARAYKAADDAGNTFQRNAIARAIGGSRSALGAGAVLQATAESGGLNALTQEKIKDGSVLAPETVSRLSDLKVQIEQTNDRARKLIDSLFSEDVLDREKRSADIYESLAKSLAQTAANYGSMAAQFLSAAATGVPPQPQLTDEEWAQQQQTRLNALVKKQKELNSDLDFYRFKAKETAEQNPWAADDAAMVATLEKNLAAVNKEIDGLRKKTATRVEIDLPKGAAAPLPPVDPRANQRTPAPTSEFLLNAPGGLREQAALLGAALLPTEALRLKQTELNAAIERNAALSGVATRALAAFVLAQQQAAVSARERLGIVTQEDLARLRSAELDDQQARGFIRNADERARAEQIVAKEIRATMQAQEIRAARFSGLKSLELESRDLDKQLDQLGTEATSSLASGLADIPFAADGANMSLQRLEQQLARLALQMVINMTMGRLLSTVFQGLFGLFPTPGGAPPIPLAQDGLPVLRAGGGGVDPGQWAVVGERGWELMRARPGGGVDVYSNATSRLMMPSLPGFAGGGGFDRYGGIVPAPALAPTGGGMPVVINNYSGEPAEARPTRGPDGREQIEVTIGGVVRKQMSKGDYDSVGAARWGVSRQTVKRG